MMKKIHRKVIFLGKMIKIILTNYVRNHTIFSRKGKLIERQGRKAKGLRFNTRIAGCRINLNVIDA